MNGAQPALLLVENTDDLNQDVAEDGSTPQNRYVLGLLLLALLIVALIAILSYRAWFISNNQNQEAELSRQILVQTNTLLSSLKDAETGQRGFLLMANERYLEPYQQALIDIPVSLNSLTQIDTVRRPDQARRVERLKPLVKAKLNELQITIQLRRTKGPESALAMVRTNQGKANMDLIRGICLEIQNASRIRVTRFSEQARRSANQASIIAVGGSAGLFLLLCLATIVIRRGMQRRQQLISALQKSGLECEESRDWLETTLASIGDGVIATDATGHITFLNSIAQSLTGWTQTQAKGRCLDDVFAIANEETGVLVESPVHKALREGRIVGLANHTKLTSKDGRELPIDDSAAPIWNKAGKVTGVVLVFREISERKKAEDERRQAEQRFRTAVSASSDILWTNNAEGKMEGEQPGWAAFTGQSFEDYQGYGWSKMVHPDDVQRTINEWNRSVAERRKFSFEHRVRRFDGIWRYCSVNALPVLDNAGAIREWVGVHADITEKRVSEERLRTLLDANPIGVLAGDVYGRVHEANDAYLSLVGYTREDLLSGRVNWKELTPPEFVMLDERGIAEAKEKGKCTPYEKEYVRSDGSRVPAYVGFALLGEAREESVAFIVDLTERKQAEAEVRASEERFRQLAESMPQVVWTATPSGVCDYVNRRWTELTGCDLAATRDTVYMASMLPEDVQALNQAASDGLRSGLPYSVECRFRRHSDGCLLWFLVRATPVKNASGEIVKWFGTSTDIDEQKRSEEELRRANKDLESFAYSASHDLQEPLRMISAYSQMLVRSYGQADEKSSLCVQYILDGAARMSKLLDDLLDYTRVNSDDELLEPVNLNQVLQNVLANLKAAIDESMSVVTSDDLPTAIGHQSHFLQLFQNLIGNSIKYRGQQTPKIHVSAARSYDGWRLSVGDNGIGIPAEYHENIFGVFKRLHGKAIPGTGIGLAICQRVVERMGGRIWVESKLNRGATFNFTVPEISNGVHRVNMDSAASVVQ